MRKEGREVDTGRLKRRKTGKTVPLLDAIPSILALPGGAIGCSRGSKRAVWGFCAPRKQLPAAHFHTSSPRLITLRPPCQAKNHVEMGKPDVGQASRMSVPSETDVP